MDENGRIKKVNNRLKKYAEETELIDILRVIWKRKYVLILGTILIGLAAMIISFNMTKIYSVTMVLSPGILKIDKNGKNIYVDSPENIKTLISSNLFNHAVLSDIDQKKADNVPRKLNFKITVPKRSNILKVRYETADKKLGMAIQNQLEELLVKKYNKIIQYYRNEYDRKISLIGSEIDDIKVSIQSNKKSAISMEKRIDELKLEIESIKNNAAILIKEKNKFLSKNSKENNILSALLYTTTIQQNLRLSNDYRNQINQYELKKQNELKQIEQSENKIAMKLNEIKGLRFKRDNIQAIRILQPASSSAYPVKPKIILNTILTSILGYFLILFLVFFLEYLNKHKKIKRT